MSDPYFEAISTCPSLVYLFSAIILMTTRQCVSPWDGNGHREDVREKASTRAIPELAFARVRSGLKKESRRRLS